MKKFGDNQTICFLGDSLTNNNIWQMQIYTYYLHRRAKNLRLFCCGTSGGTAQQGYLYRNIDLYRYKPDHVSIMFGINDLRPSLYADDADEVTVEYRAKRFADYKLNMRRLVEDIVGSGATVNLCTPMPYDSGLVTDYGTNNRSCSPAVEVCAEFVKELAAEYRLDCVDFCDVASRLNREIQKNSPNVSLTSKDRIHPNTTGYNVMARIYLSAQGFDDVTVPTADEILRGDLKVLPIDKKVLERGNFESDLRRLFSVEWMKIVENDPEKFNVGADEKIEIMRIQESKLKETAAEYFKFSIPFYIANKHRQEEFFQKIISLTDEIVKSGSKNEPVHIDEL